MTTRTGRISVHLTALSCGVAWFALAAPTLLGQQPPAADAAGQSQQPAPQGSTAPPPSPAGGNLPAGPVVTLEGPGVITQIPPPIQEPGRPVVPPTPVKPPQPAIPAPTVTLKPGEQPKIDFDEPNYKFGRIKAGADIFHDFWFTNTGTGPLEILMFKPACGCTTTGQYDRVIMPGESGKIPIKVTTGKFSGPISKTATVHTNCADPAQSTITLKIEGDIWLPISCTPNAASFGNITSDQAAGPAPLERHVTILNNVDTPTTIRELKCSSPAFRVETQELEPGKKWDLKVTALTPLNPGNSYGQITFKTDLAEMPDVTLAATCYVAPDVDFTPTQIILVPQPNQTIPITRQVTVRNNMPAPITVTDLVCTSSEVKVSMREQTPGKMFVITVEAPAQYKPGPEDKISFKTSNPKHAQVNIPIQYRAAMMPPSMARTNPAPAGAPVINSTGMTTASPAVNLSATGGQPSTGGTAPTLGATGAQPNATAVQPNMSATGSNPPAAPPK